MGRDHVTSSCGWGRARNAGPSTSSATADFAQDDCRRGEAGFGRGFAAHFIS
jgi:hypothetical protein